MPEIFPHGLRTQPFTVFSNMRINNEVRLQRGWFACIRKMLDGLETPYVFYWSVVHADRS